MRFFHHSSVNTSSAILHMPKGFSSLVFAEFSGASFFFISPSRLDTFPLIPISLFFDTCQRLSRISCHCVPIQDPPKAIDAIYAGCLLSHSAPLPSLSFMGNSSMIFPLLCPLNSFKIQTVSGCQLSCLWLPLCLLLSSKSFLTALIFRIVRASPRHSFPHPSFVLLHGFSFLFTSLQLRGSPQFVVLPPCYFRYTCCLSFPQDRGGLVFWYSLLRLYLKVLLCCSIISPAPAWSAFSLF